MQVKIANKIHAAQRQKKNLDGLCEVFSPGSTVGKVSPTTCVIQVANRPEVRFQSSEIAKFGMQNERDADLAQYIDRRPKEFPVKNLEQKIINHKKDLLRKDLGSKKIKRNCKHPDEVSVICSGRSCISPSSNVSWAFKMRIPKRNTMH